MIQMITQGQWLDHSPLINIPCFETGEIIRKLADRGILYLQQLIPKCNGDIKNFFERELKHPLPMEDLKEIFRALEKVPLVDLKYSLARTNSQEELLTNEPLNEGEEAVLMVNLRRHNRSNSQFCTISNFPKPKDCSWFLLVCVAGKNEMLAMRRITFKRYCSKRLNLVLPKDFSEKLEVHLMCDSYLGLDQMYTVDLEKVNDAIIKQRKHAEDDYDDELEEAQFDPE